jgi:hypothetical protein
MSRTYSRPHRQPSSPSPVQNLAWWKSSLILGSIIAGISIIASTLWIEYTTQRVIHIRADDSSDDDFPYLTQEDILACLNYAVDRERQTLLIQA